MTGFQFDFNDTFEGGLKDGEYEVIIETMKESATKGGSVYIDIPLVVRNDIDQQGKNQKIFHKIWQKKDTGKYNKSMLNTLGKYARMDENKVYNSLQDVFDDLVGKPVKVRIKNTESEYNGKTYHNLEVAQWEFTAYPTVQHKWKEGNDPTAVIQPTVNEDDLPF
ncbi:DUF669 domain-containing protein [Facklamia hominis]|uniref:DUF669 domain-containing protein n=1 Tax=Facklamia hominis TaxID=178214 RepID=UPI0038FCD3E3